MKWPLTGQERCTHDIGKQMFYTLSPLCTLFLSDGGFSWHQRVRFIGPGAFIRACLWLPCIGLHPNANHSPRTQPVSIDMTAAIIRSALYL